MTASSASPPFDEHPMTPTPDPVSKRRGFAAVAMILAMSVGGAACSAGDGDRAARPPTSTTSTGLSTTTTPSTVAPTTTEVPTTPATTTGAARTVAGPADASSAAAAIIRTETAIRNPDTPAGELEALGEEQQIAYRRLVERPEWMRQVLARVPNALHPTVQANVTAGAELRALTKPRTELPPWRIVAPAPAPELLGYYRAAESQIGVPWQYLAAIHLVETRMGRIRGTSTAGAQGPMQFLPSTWRQYGAGGDINSNRDAILAAARLLARNGAPGNMSNALYNYNRSQRYVTAVTAYAEQMREDERAYLGYYHWQVFYRLVEGDRLLPVGYGT